MKTAMLFICFLVRVNNSQRHFSSFELNRLNDFEPAKDKNDELGGSILDMINPSDDEESTNKREPYSPTVGNPFEDTPLTAEDLKKIEEEKKAALSTNSIDAIKPKIPYTEEKEEEKIEKKPEPKPEPKPKPKPEKRVPEPAPTPIATEPIKSPIKAIGVGEIDKLINRVHYPFPESDKIKKNVKIWAIVILIIFGTTYLLLRSLYNYLKNLNKFINKSIAALSNQLMLLIVSFILFTILYIYGALDSIQINWQYLLSGIALFILSWFIYGCSQIIFSLMIIKKWNTLESSENTFKSLRDKFDTNANLKYDKDTKKLYSPQKEREIIDSFEFLVLKRFFFIPLFPVFKASSLRKEMKFSVYLTNCLLSKLRQFYKLSWSSWISLIITMMMWNVFVAPSSALFVSIFMMLIPLLGILFIAIVYFYLKHIYYKVIDHVTQDNMCNYQDIEYNSNLLLQSMGYPKYLVNLIQSEEAMNKAAKQTWGFHQHFHQKPASLYEDLIIFGETGLKFLMNMAQSACVVFACWTVITFTYHMPTIIAAQSHLALIYMIPALLIYFLGQSYLSSILLKWYTIISSIEMKRNDKCIQKTIDYHLKKASEISESIFLSFKRLYFDMKSNDKVNEKDDLDIEYKENEFELGYKHFREIIKDSVLQFTHTYNNKEPGEIDIDKELKPFLKSFGNSLSNEEIEFMLHLIDKFDEFKGKLSINNLYDIYGAILFFRTQKPSAIVKYVFDTFYKDNPQLYRSSEMNYQAIELFISNYSNFFTKEQTAFIKEQCNYSGETFTLDTFIMTILSFRQYCPY